VDPKIIAAIIGGLSGLAVAYLSYKSGRYVSKLNLSAKHRSEIVKRQLDAFESLWSIFDAACSSGGEGRMIKHVQNKKYISVSECEKFVRELEERFNGKSGYYISVKCRNALFKFRDHIRENFILNSGKEDLVVFSNEKEFFDKRTFARLSLRAEVGTTDLKVTQEELKKYEDKNT